MGNCNPCVCGGSTHGKVCEVGCCSKKKKKSF